MGDYNIRWPESWKEGTGTTIAAMGGPTDSAGVASVQYRDDQADRRRVEADEQHTGNPSQGIEPGELSRKRTDFDATVIPHQFTYAAVYNTINRLHRSRSSDEALRNSREDALAMWRDPFVHDLIRQRQRPVVALPFELKPDDPKDKGQAKVCAKLTKLIEAIPDFQGLKLNLQDAVFFGKAGSQLTFGQVLVDRRPMVGIVDHRPVHGDKIVWTWEGTPGVYVYGPFNPENATIITGDQGRVLLLDSPWWRRRFVIHKFERSDTDYLFETEQAASVYGVGLRSRLYWAWWLRQELYSWWCDALQRIGTNGQYLGFYDESNPKSKRQVAEGLKTLQRDNLAVLPRKFDGTKTPAFEHIEPYNVAYVELRTGVEHIEGIMRRVVLGDDQAKGGQKEDGRVTEAKDDGRTQIIRFDAQSLGETLTRELVEPLIEMNVWNYRGQNLRKLPFKVRLALKIDSEKLLERITVAEKLTGLGIQIDGEQLRDEAGFSAPRDGQVVAQATQHPGGDGQQKHPTSGPRNTPGEAKAPKPSPNQRVAQQAALPDRYARQRARRREHVLVRFARGFERQETLPFAASQPTAPKGDNCGTGAGGFKAGNTCSRSGKEAGPAPTTPPRSFALAAPQAPARARNLFNARTVDPVVSPEPEAPAMIAPEAPAVPVAAPATPPPADEPTPTPDAPAATLEAPDATPEPAPAPVPADMPTGPYTLDGHQDVSRRIQRGEMGAHELRHHLERLIAHEAEIKTELGKRTIKQLAPRGAGGLKKGELVDQIYDGMLGRFTLGQGYSYSMPLGRGDWSKAKADAVRRKAATLTDDDVRQYAEARGEAVAQRVKELTNPETLGEFRRFVEAKGYQHLTPDQRATFDDLAAKDRREQETTRAARESTVRGVDLGERGITTQLHKGWHAKKQVDTHVVTLSDRVDRDEYESINAKAKALGGYYSSFRGGGAIAGFQFDTQEKAERFRAVLAGQDQDGGEQHAERRAERIENASERLKALGAVSRERAEESLGRDRLANTARRAGMAASAEGEARRQLRLADTMDRIGDAMQAGTVHHLNGIRSRTHVEQLEGLLSRARWNHIAAKQKEAGGSLPHREFEEMQQRPILAEDIHHAEYPHPYVHRDTLANFAASLRAVPGAKLLSARLDKLGKREGDSDWGVRLRNPRDIEDLRDLIGKAKGSGIGQRHTLQSLEESLRAYDRLQKADIKTTGELRAALREYHGLRGKPREADPLKEMERKLIGTKIDGFFPTPPSLVHRMLEAADIQAGHSVLEPSAGKGDILDAIRDNHPDANAVGIEPHGSLREIVAAKGHTLAGSDFLEHTGKYDRIVMNPPFERGADVVHVRHAYDQLAPGGRLVAIMSAGPFSRSDAKATGFRDWLDQVGGEHEELPEGSFSGADAFRQTGVNTRLVVIEKPGE